MAGRRAIWWVCGWSSVQDLLWKIRSLIVLHSTNIATHNIIQREEKKLLFIMNNFLVISHLSAEACWFIYKQNTHVSSLISLWLSPLTFSKQLSPHRSKAPQAERGWNVDVPLFASSFRGLFLTQHTHTCDSQVGLQHLWRYLTWHKGAGRKMSFNFMDRENGAFCRGGEQAKQIGFILR